MVVVQLTERSLPKADDLGLYSKYIEMDVKQKTISYDGPFQYTLHLTIIKNLLST